MIINLFCGQCIQESMENNEIITELIVPSDNISDSGLYDVCCDKGHHTKVALLNAKFELLFEIGFNGIIDGYNREAISSFTASLERYYEFFINTTFYHELDSDEFKSLWNLISNQSERQLGAYTVLYLDKIKKYPMLLSNNEVSFRNKVIHKGYIPTKEEALRYGERVRDIINNSIIEMKKVFIDTLIPSYEKMIPQQANKEISFACNITTIIDLRNGPLFSEGDVRNLSLVELIEPTLNRRVPQRMRMFKSSEELENYNESK